jgi:hypothetical protein
VKCTQAVSSSHHMSTRGLIGADDAHAMHAAALTAAAAAAAAVHGYCICASKANPDARESLNINNHCQTDTTGPPPRLPAAGTAPRRSVATFPVHGEARRVVLVLELLGLQVVVDASDWHGSRPRVHVSKHTY